MILTPSQEEIVLTIPCEFCGQQAGRPCLGVTNAKRRDQSHQWRIRDAVRQGLLPGEVSDGPVTFT
jgi:hypothetical protein